METFSALLSLCAGNSPVTSEFPSQRPLMRSFDVFFHLRLNKRLRKQSRRLWFETPSHSLWRDCNVSWNLLICNAYQFCSSNLWVLQHHSVFFWNEHHYRYYVFRVRIFGKPELICLIGIQWETTGTTSTLGCHCNHTGWWWSNGNPVVICIIGTHCREDHWMHAGGTLATNNFFSKSIPVYTGD